MQLIGLMLTHNDENRYLEKVIENNLKFCDILCILDNFSNDNTYKILQEYKNKYKNRIYIKKSKNTWDNEVLLRNELLEFGLSKNPDYIIVIDSDEIYTEEFINESKEIMEKNILLSAFYFYNIWDLDKNKYRNDEYFGVNYGIRMCNAKLLKNGYEWQNSKRHCGSLPYSILNNSFYISKTKVKHLGYAIKKDRVKKYEEKVKDDPNNEFYSKEIYNEILNDNPITYEF